MVLFKGELITGIVGERPVLVVHLVKGLPVVVKIIFRINECLTIDTSYYTKIAKWGQNCNIYPYGIVELQTT